MTWMVEIGFWQEGLLAQQGGFLSNPVFPIMMIMIIGYFLLFNPERKRRAETQRMLDELKKNDRIVTIGGICGTVVNVPADSKEVTIRVDDNTRIRVLRTAIANVVVEESAKDSEKKS